MIFIDHFSKPHGAYILSHFHSDHMHGLRAGWRLGFIHCSEVTARLLRARFTGLAIRPHALEEPFVVEDPTNPRREVFATFVEANHCPGSVIVVVEGLPAGPIVNTGDFRYYDGLLDSPALRHLVSARDTSDGQRCQKLCLDTTWAHAAFERLPSKIESIGYVLDLIEAHRSDRCFFYIAIASATKRSWAQSLTCLNLGRNCASPIRPGSRSFNSRRCRLSTAVSYLVMDPWAPNALLLLRGLVREHGIDGWRARAGSRSAAVRSGGRDVHHGPSLTGGRCLCAIRGSFTCSLLCTRRWGSCARLLKLSGHGRCIQFARRLLRLVEIETW